MKKILLPVLMILLLTGCGNVELKNGENAVVSFKNKEGISSNELYNSLKKTYGTTKLIDLIDTTLLDKEYKDDANTNKYITGVVSSVKKDAGENYLSYIKSYYNVDSEEEFKEYVKLNYKRSLWIADYAKTTVTEKQIKDYYESYTIGDIEASHILITSDAANDATEEVKKAEDKKAYEAAKQIIAELDKGSKFSELAKRYSKDSANASNGGALGAFNRKGMDKSFVEGAIKLKVNEYSKEPVKSQYGYHIILKTKQNEKPTLEKAKKEIIETISNELVENDKSMYIKALEKLREKYNMKINDSELKSSYDTYMNKLYAQNTGK
ncbi:MAG: peptidylprolyl isomerase [Bacilli bacterium]